MLNDGLDIARCSVCLQVNTGDFIFLIITLDFVSFICYHCLFNSVTRNMQKQSSLLPLVTYVSIKSVCTYLIHFRNSRNIHSVKVFTIVR